jgi:hypothetical protein
MTKTPHAATRKIIDFMVFGSPENSCFSVFITFWQAGGGENEVEFTA